MQTKIPCVIMRGGTSRALYFEAKDLPADPATRDAILLAAMGSPDARQIDGVGGATVGPSPARLGAHARILPGFYGFAAMSRLSSSSVPSRAAACAVSTAPRSIA